MSTIDRVLQLSKEKGITQAFICGKLGVRRTYLSEVRIGKDSLPDDRLAIIANILNTTPEYLKGETDTKDTKEKPATSQDDELISALKDPQIMKLVKRLYDAPKEERDRLERIIDAALGNPK